MSCLELRQILRAEDARRARVRIVKTEKALDAQLSVPEAFELSVDELTREQVQSALEALEEQYSVRDDPADKAELADEISKHRHYLSSVMNVHGRPRQTGDAEKARLSVTKAIRTALNKMKSRQELYGHMDDALVLGADCAYKPKPPVHWQVER